MENVCRSCGSYDGGKVLSYPVVDEGNKLQGIISRQDVLQALQMIQRQPQVGETIDDIVTNQFMTPKEAKMSIYINFQ